VGDSSIERVNELAERIHDEIAICHRHTFRHQAFSQRFESARD
jgi:hypothetical protein